MKGKLGKSYLREIEDLGEFTFIFTKTPLEEIKPGTSKYYVEALWNPENYGLVDFIIGYYIEDIDEEIDRYESEDGLDYFIDGARISCECRIASGHDDEGVYTGILMDYFEYTEEEIDEIESEED